MPANPLSEDQLAEAAKLKDLFSRWQRARKERGLPSSQEAVSGLLGFNQSSVSQYLNGSIPLNVNAAVKWAEVLGCPVSDFSPSMAAQAERYSAAAAPDMAALLNLPGARRVAVADVDDPFLVRIKKVKLRVSAGVTGFMVDPEFDDGGELTVDPRWMAKNRFNPEQLIAITVRGESMEPGLYEDDVVIVNTADNSKADGGVFVFNYEGEVVVKRLSRDVGEWWLTSDNPDQRRYHRKLCRNGECIIVGRVVQKISNQI